MNHYIIFQKLAVTFSLRTLFSVALSLCSSLNMKYHTLVQYKQESVMVRHH